MFPLYIVEHVPLLQFGNPDLLVCFGKPLLITSIMCFYRDNIFVKRSVPTVCFAHTAIKRGEIAQR